MRDLVARNLPAEDFDAFMMSVCSSPEPWRLRLDDHFLTRGGLEWGDALWRMGSGCELYGEGTIELIPDIPDERLKVQAPIHLVPSVRGWAQGLTGETAWRAVPTGMKVQGLTFALNHSKLAAKARALGVSLRISAAVLQGHNAGIRDVTAYDCGALGLESFPFVITGAQDGYDRHALASVADGVHTFDDSLLIRSYIRNVTIDGYVPSESNAQVSHAMIVGALTNDRLRSDAWGEIGTYRHIFRRNPIIENVRGKASGDNLCQLATIYQCDSGEITRCESRGYHAGAYHDFYSSYDLDVHHNDFEAKRPVAFLLSPVDPKGMPSEQELTRTYSHDRPSVRSNKLRCLPVDAGWHAGVLAMTIEPGGTRRIRSLNIDDNDIEMQGPESRENYAVQAQGVSGLAVTGNRVTGFAHPWRIWPDCTNVTPPEIQEGYRAPSSKKGCNPFRR